LVNQLWLRNQIYLDNAQELLQMPTASYFKLKKHSIVTLTHLSPALTDLTHSKKSAEGLSSTLSVLASILLRLPAISELIVAFGTPS